MVSLKLQVTSLKQVYNMVEVQLYPYNPPPSPEEIERARAEAKLDESEPPVIDEEKAAKKILGSSLSIDQDEAVVQKIIRIYRQELPEFFEKKPPQAIFHARGMTPIPTSQTLLLTIDQYQKLGSPSLLSLLTVTIDFNELKEEK